MQLNEERMSRILKKYKRDFDEMALYDETREKLWAKKRIDITLTERVIKRLKELTAHKNPNPSYAELLELSTEFMLSKIDPLKKDKKESY